MKKVLTFLIGVVLTISISAQDSADPDNNLPLGQILPEFKITTMDGKEFKSDELKGKTVLINFFATWCGPCRLELPHVKSDIWEKYKDRKDFVLLIISREEKPEKVKPFIADNDYPMNFYSDIDRSCYKLFAEKYIPRNYLFNKEGKLIFQSKGFVQQDFDKLLEMITVELK